MKNSATIDELKSRAALRKTKMKSCTDRDARIDDFVAKLMALPCDERDEIIDLVTLMEELEIDPSEDPCMSEDWCS